MDIAYPIEYYEENGKCPVIDFHNTLSPKELSKAFREIDMLQQFGLSLGMPYIRRLDGTDELWELRMKHSSNIFRIFYFHSTHGVFVLLHGIKKKTEKTPQRDIDLAEKRIRLYKERK